MTDTFDGIKTVAHFYHTDPVGDSNPIYRGSQVARQKTMNRELIVNVTPAEMQIALCEDKVLVELNKEQCQTGFAVGDIYLGKVRKIMPGLNAAFVNIGHEKDAFIHYSDLGNHFASLKKLADRRDNPMIHPGHGASCTLSDADIIRAIRYREI